MLRRTPMKRKAPVKANAERAFHGHIATLPCLICWGTPIEVHHVRHNGRHGITRNHKLVIPLCPDHHRTGPRAVHVIGSPQFDAMHRLSQYDEAVKLWEEYNG